MADSAFAVEGGQHGSPEDGSGCPTEASRGEEGSHEAARRQHSIEVQHDERQAGRQHRLLKVQLPAGHSFLSRLAQSCSSRRFFST